MSSCATEQVLSFVIESASIATIEEIELGSANFESDRTCTLLAQLIDIALNLKIC